MKHRAFLITLLLIAVAATATQSLSQSVYEPYTFTTLAGLAGNVGSADGPETTARFNGPHGVAVDGAGNVYVADTFNSTVRKVTPAGIVTTLAGRAGSSGSVDGTGSAARFGTLAPGGLSGVAVDNMGNVYVADTYPNSTIRKVTPSGVVSTLAGSPGSYDWVDGTGRDARFYFPLGVAVDSADNVYVADKFTHVIRKVTPTGVVRTLAGLAGNPGSADGSGSAARFGEPVSVTVDSVGNVYVVDIDNFTVRKMTPVGTNWVVTTVAGRAGHSGSADGTGSAARFGILKGVAVDSSGNLYVADFGNNTIRKVTPIGTNWVVTTLAGKALSTGSSDGTGSAARFNEPFGIAVDRMGNVYVGDSLNHTIRKGSPAPMILNSGFSDREFGFVLTGPIGQSAVIEASTNLVNWLPIWTNNCTNTLTFSDPRSGAFSNRFYRAAVLGAPTNMVFIPPGTFRMGSPTNEVDRSDNEGPQTTVTISRGFWMGAYEVTQGEYQALMGSNPSYFSTNNGFAQNLSRPVEKVSWLDATNYCGKLTQQERAAGRIPSGTQFRLPTEAEWEYACRAGTSTRFSYGDDPGYRNLTNYAWYSDNSGAMTHPVGQKSPNPWGLYDMDGNVDEWCQDWWAESLPGGIAVDPQGPAPSSTSDSPRVLRGGSWYSVGQNCRSASRDACSVVCLWRNNDIGFRVVLAPGQP